MGIKTVTLVFPVAVVNSGHENWFVHPGNAPFSQCQGHTDLFYGANKHREGYFDQQQTNLLIQ